jgi:DNA-binding protein Fis
VPRLLVNPLEVDLELRVHFGAAVSRGITLRPFRRTSGSDRIDDSPVLDPEVEALFAKYYRLATGNRQPLTLRAWLEGAEAWMIADALEKAGGNHTQAARVLGIGRRTLYGRKKKLGIHRPRSDGETSGSSPRVAESAPATVRRGWTASRKAALRGVPTLRRR